jgi:hypothetical protein
MNKPLICDCARAYTPPPKYKDTRVRCKDCLKTLKSSEVKAKCVEYLGGKCVDCGFEGPAVAFDFDHRNPTSKEFKISGNYLFRWAVIKKELDKCELRCCRCHRIKHYYEQNHIV